MATSSLCRLFTELWDFLYCLDWKNPESFHTKKEICFWGTGHEPPLPYTLANLAAPLFPCIIIAMHLKTWVLRESGGIATYSAFLFATHKYTLQSRLCYSFYYICCCRDEKGSTEGLSALILPHNHSHRRESFLYRYTIATTVMGLYDLKGPVSNAFDAGKSITRARGGGFDSVNWDFFGPCKMVSSCQASAIWGKKRWDFQGPTSSHLPS